MPFLAKEQWNNKINGNFIIELTLAKSGIFILSFPETSSELLLFLLQKKSLCL